MTSASFGKNPSHPFDRLGIPRRPVVLAPLAGVSDHPFRRICSRLGADLTYVEMLSARALLHESRRTYEIMTRHPSEALLGVQVTGATPDDVGRAVEVLDKLSYETIDLNMGCPVQKVVKGGCGSAILRDPGLVREVVKAARAATGKPLSVKVRLGWDKTALTIDEVADAVEAGGADWLTIHGRTRACDYSDPVDLARIAAVKARLAIPVLGNGNVFTTSDAASMSARTLVDGVMVSRGALGNPWIFRELKGGAADVHVDEWEATVLDHLAWQAEEYQVRPDVGAVCMRKHLLWYVKGWPGAKKLRAELGQVSRLDDAARMVRDYAASLRESGVLTRAPTSQEEPGNRFVWDPKFEMDRQLDRGVGALGLDSESANAQQ
jgi:tRNA-dihydrouridine synthase B